MLMFAFKKGGIMVVHHRNVSLESIVEEIDGVVYAEEWRKIVGFEKRYEVSSFGRVKRRAYLLKNGVYKPEKILLASSGVRRGKRRYLKVHLVSDTVKKSYSVHRLVGLHFLPLVDGKPHINHKTGDKLKNHYSQLEWCTVYENIEHSVKIGLAKRGRNIKPYVKKGYRVGVKQIINIETKEIIPHAVALKEKTGMSIKTIRRFLSGERYNHTPYRYVGQEDLCKIMPPKPIKETRIGKFNSNGELIHVHSSLQEIPMPLRHVVGSFLKGRIGNAQGYLYKLMGADGGFIEPPKFVPNRKPRPQRGPTTPSKRLIQYDLQGNVIKEHESINKAAQSVGVDASNFKKSMRGPRGFCKGFIWKLA